MDAIGFINKWVNEKDRGLTKEFLVKVGIFVTHTIAYYFLGTIVVFLVGALSEFLPVIINSYFSLPFWGFAVANSVVGFIVVSLYKKLPDFPETQESI